MFRLSKLDKLCRRYEMDLWNQVLFSNKITKLSSFFVRKRQLRRALSKANSSFLRIDVVRRGPRKRRVSAFGKLLETRKKICLFYGGLSKKKYRSLNWRAKKMSGDYNLNMLFLLESQLCSIVFRMNTVKSILEGIHLVLSGCIIVNKKVVLNPHHLVQLGDIVEVIPAKKEERFDRLLSLLSSKGLLLPRYFEVNYPLLCCIFLQYPKFNEVSYGFTFNSQFFFSEFTGKF